MSGPDSVDPRVPFNLPQVLTNGMRHGAGRLFRLAGIAANTDTTIAHQLGRIPHFVIPLDNGTNFVPATARSAVTAWTANTVTVQFSAAFSGWVWVV